MKYRVIKKKSAGSCTPAHNSLHHNPLKMACCIVALSSLQMLWATPPFDTTLSDLKVSDLKVSDLKVSDLKVSEKQLIGKATSLDPAQTKVWVLGPLLDVYLGPSTGYPIVNTLEKGDRVTLIKQFTQWIKIISKETHVGWIQQQDLIKLADAEGRVLTSQRLPAKKAGAFSVQFALGTMDGSVGGTSSLGYGLSDNLRADMVLLHTTEGDLQGRGIKGQLAFDLKQKNHWQPYLNLGYGTYNIDGTIFGQNTFNTLSAGFGVRRHLIGGLEGTFEYSQDIILISGPRNIHADVIRLGIFTYF